MGIKIEYYCDRCKKQVKDEDELSSIEVSFASDEGIQHRDVCFDCWKQYMDGIIEISKKLFK
ncbi:MAG: hypothetical protein E6356_14125 [Terrisporobacter othiniensis]|nr:hypothetical protein [Terrisporobacter othiniensis]